VKKRSEKMKQVAIVTGAAKGIGLGIAETLCEEGYQVLMLSRGIDVLGRAEELQKLGFMTKGYVCDIANLQMIQKTIEEIIEEFGKIDVLINNAGIAKMKKFEEIDDVLLNDHIDINIKGTWYMTKAVIPYMKKANYGRIITMSSVTGTMVCDKGYTAYGMTKAALIGLTKTIAMEYAEYGITSNAICPGYICTPNVIKGSKNAHPEDPERVIKEIAAGIPMKKLGTPKQIGSAVAFLASPESAYITGTSLVIDGGNMLPETNAVRF
jgi:NAD(P)-dependent dehydrogenase (short-subunit alcohol dehydrogenase family)